MADAILKISADTREAAEQLVKLQKESAERLAKIQDKFEGLALGAKAAFAAVAGFIAGKQIFGFLEESVQLAAEAEVAITSLNTALQTSGIYSEETAKSFEELAKQIQATTTYEDDAILSSIALFQNIARLDEEGLKSATIATTDFAAAMEIDLDTAFRMVAKATQGNLIAFQKMGIHIAKGKTESEQLANVMQALSAYQGIAASKSNTYSGAIVQMQHAWADFREELGSIITQNPMVIGVIKSITESIQRLTGVTKDNKIDIKLAIGESLISALNAITPLLNGIAAVTAAIGDFIKLLGMVTVYVGKMASLVAEYNPFTIMAEALIELGAFALDIISSIIRPFTALGTFLPGAIGRAFESADASVEEFGATMKVIHQEGYGGAKMLGAAIEGITEKVAPVTDAIGDFAINSGEKIAVVAESFAGAGDRVKEMNLETKQLGKTGKPSLDSFAESAKSVLYPIENILKATQDLTAENDKRGKSVLEVMQVELDGKRELAALTESEAKMNLQRGKITQQEYNNAVMITEQYVALAEAKALADRAEYFKKSPLDFSVQDISNFKEAVNGAVAWSMENAAKYFRELTIGDLIDGIGTAFSTASDLIVGAMSGKFLTDLTSVVSAIGGAPAAFMQALDTLDSTISGLLKDLPSVMEKILYKLPAIFGRVIEALPKLVTLLVEKVLPALFSQLAKILPELVSTLMDAITKLFEKLPEILAPLIEALPKILNAFLEKLPKAIRVALKSLGQIGAQLIKALPDMIVMIIEAIPDITEALIVGLSEGSGEIVVGMVDALLMKGGLERIVKALVLFYPKFYRAMYVGMWEAAKKVAPMMGTMIASGWYAAMENKYVKKIAEKLSFKIDMSWLYQIGPAIAGVGNAIWLNLKNQLIGEGYGIFGGLGATIWNGFKGIADIYNDFMMRKGMEIWSGFTAAAQASGSYFYTMGNNIWNGLYNKVVEYWDTWAKMGREIWNALSNALIANWQTFINAGGAIGYGLSSSILKIWDWFESMGNNIAVGFAKAMPGNNIGGGIAGGFAKVTGGLSGAAAATGMTVPKGYPNDSFPARLTSDEVVVPSDDVARLRNFLDSQERGYSNRSNETGSGGLVNVVLKIGEQELAKVLLNLNRAGYRTA